MGTATTDEYTIEDKELIKAIAKKLERVFIYLTTEVWDGTKMNETNEKKSIGEKCKRLLAQKIAMTQSKANDDVNRMIEDENAGEKLVEESSRLSAEKIMKKYEACFRQIEQLQKRQLRLNSSGRGQEGPLPENIGSG